MDERNSLGGRPYVSILMNCYNGAKFLQRAVDSLLGQSYTNWELIFWDNQSADNSAATIQQYKDSRIRYFYANEHTELGTARRKAAEQATGEWIGVLDVDDYWYENNLTFKLCLSEIPDEVGLIYSRYVIDRSLLGKRSMIYPKVRRLPSGRHLKMLAKYNFVGLVTALYRKKAYDYVGGFNNYQIVADWDLSIRIAKYFDVKGIDAVTAVYTEHGENLSIKNVPELFRERANMLEQIEDQSLKRSAFAAMTLDYVLLDKPSRKLISNIKIERKVILSRQLLLLVLVRVIRRLGYLLVKGNYDDESGSAVIIRDLKKMHPPILEKFKRGRNL